MKVFFSLFWVAGKSWEPGGSAVNFFAHVAQLVEHILGKDEVTSSNLVMGSSFRRLKSAELVK